MGRGHTRERAHAAKAPSRRTAAARAPLPFGLRRLDGFLGPMMPGQVMLLESNTAHIFDITYMAMVSALSEDRGAVVFVDGCNSINPYEVVRLCKRFGMDPNRALDRIRLCRAFTAYQMSAVIDEQLEAAMGGCALLVVSGLGYLYADKDVRKDEAETLLRRAASRISDLAAAFGCPALVTDLAGRGRPELRGAAAAYCHRRARVLAARKKMKIVDVSGGRAVDYLPVPIYQTILDEFGGA